jgi:hypothetical protein
VLRRLREAADLAALLFQDAMVAMGSTDRRRADRDLVPFSGDRRRAPVWEHRNLGCIPGRCSFSDGFIDCGSFQSLCATGLPLFRGGLRIFSSDGGRRFVGRDRRWRFRMPAGSTGPTAFFVISVLGRDLCASWLGQLSMYPARTYLYLYASLYVFLI